MHNLTTLSGNRQDLMIAITSGKCAILDTNTVSYKLAITTNNSHYVVMKFNLWCDNL